MMWLRTDSNPTDINQLRNHTGKYSGKDRQIDWPFYGQVDRYINGQL